MANNFSGDSHCIALYKYGTVAGLTGDSKNSNTLSTSASSPTQSSTQAHEGSHSANFVAASSQYFYILDSSLASNFPLKSGTSNKTISVASWVYFTSFAVDGNGATIWSKYTTSGGAFRTAFLRAHNTSGTNAFRVTLGDTSGNSQGDIVHGTTLGTSTWYHVTFTYQDSDKSYGLYLRDTNGNLLGSDVTGTAASNIGLFSNSDFMLGERGSNASPTAGFYLDGYLDETVVFDDVLTASEATSIAKGTYPGQSLVMASGSYSQTGIAAIFRVGSPTYLRHRK